MLSSKVFCFNPFRENTYLLYETFGNQAMILDPGCHSRDEQNELVQFVSDNQLNPIAVWLTHCHIDHVLGLAFCIEKWNIPYYLSFPEIAQLKAVEVYAPSFGIFNTWLPEKEGVVFEAEEIRLGDEQFRILQIPGHSPGHLGFYHALSGQIWSGDVLFNQGIGRTDLPGGDLETLKNSIMEKLYTLPENTVVHPGHGPSTSIGFEKMMNPFFKLRS